MNQEFEIKKVPFMGTELVAARDADGQIWAGVKWMCNGIGLSKNQTDNQIQKLQTEKVLKRGCGKFPAGVFDPNNETIAVKLDFVPLWLAKISITPTMEQETPELAATLELYQLKAKDVLAAAFIPVEAAPDLDALSPQLRVLINLEMKQKEQERTLAAHDQELKTVNQKIDGIRDVVSLSPNSWRPEAKKLITRIAQTMGGNEYIKDVNAEIYQLVDERAGVSLKTRLTNKRRRMADEGVCKSKRDKLNKLDAIADDKKLIEIYIAVVKEMAVKYGVSVDAVPENRTE